MNRNLFSPLSHPGRWGLCLLLLTLLACTPESRQAVKSSAPTPVEGPGAHNCAPVLGWQAGLGQVNPRPACMAEASGQYRQAYRLAEEWRAVEQALKQQNLTGAERSRLLQESETLLNIARMRGWEEPHTVREER